ncbi:hypothetical protein GCM10011490_11890 [Pseudoclavibacter endophyticus]|uniref:hypothetical protein n=1 Tax=Pseudoclavibacter endophyticus TaxID=1778590 RepID=UPI00166D7BDC|nr:hypothetical protein [Pseudoclavibacter endophyticus]GGA63003.1 hypothetical protein GCM10011490_11890 [Pseudoclavibacter endophyticus]
MSSTQGPSDRGDDSLVEDSYAMSSYPAFRGKQVVLGVAALVILVTMFLPWWDAELLLDRAADTLNGWLMLVTGFSVGSLGILTGYSWFGNVMFGLVPVLPPLVVAVLAVLRVLRVYVAPAITIALWAIVSAIGQVWIIFYGTLRIDAANGVYPVMAGPWIVLVVSIGLAALCLLWWRAERVHFPPQRLFGMRRKPHAEPAPDEVPGQAVDTARSLEADELFADLDEEDPAGDDAQLSLGNDLRVTGEGAAGEAPTGAHDDGEAPTRRADDSGEPSR